MFSILVFMNRNIHLENYAEIERKSRARQEARDEDKAAEAAARQVRRSRLRKLATVATGAIGLVTAADALNSKPTAQADPNAYHVTVDMPASTSTSIKVSHPYTVQPGDNATRIFEAHATPGDDREGDIAEIQAQGSGPGHMLMAGKDKIELPEDLTR